MKISLSFAVVVGFTSSIVVAEEPLKVRWSKEEKGIQVANNITYAVAGGETLKLDIAKPEGKGPFPTVVCFHGGGWRFGHRTDTGSFMRRLAENGYAAASVSYRFMPLHKFPAQIEDAKTAVRFLRKHAGELDLDPDKFAALGLSAGGHLSLLLGLTDKSAGFDGPLYPEQSSAVQAVVDFFGPTDLNLYCTAEGIRDSFMVPLLGVKCKEDPALVRKASPIHYVTKNGAPTLIVHGNADLIVPIVHSEKLLEKMKEAGMHVEMLTVPLGGHGWSDPETRRETALAALKFLDAQLKGKK